MLQVGLLPQGVCSITRQEAPTWPGHTKRTVLRSIFQYVISYVFVYTDKKCYLSLFYVFVKFLTLRFSLLSMCYSLLAEG